MEMAEFVYESLIGELVDPLKGIENAFAPGRFCEMQYGNVLSSYERLCDRLGMVDEDGDVEQIVDSMLSIQRVLCLKMFELGIKFGDGSR